MAPLPSLFTVFDSTIKGATSERGGVLSLYFLSLPGVQNAADRRYYCLAVASLEGITSCSYCPGVEPLSVLYAASFESMTESDYSALSLSLS